MDDDGKIKKKTDIKERNVTLSICSQKQCFQQQKYKNNR